MLTNDTYFTYTFEKKVEPGKVVRVKGGWDAIVDRIVREAHSLRRDKGTKRGKLGRVSWASIILDN